MPSLQSESESKRVKSNPMNVSFDPNANKRLLQIPNKDLLLLYDGK